MFLLLNNVKPSLCNRPAELLQPRWNSTRRGRVRFVSSTSSFTDLKINSTSKKVTKLRKDLEECRIQHDATLVSLKKKQADSIAEVMIISSYIKVIIYSKKYIHA